MPAYNSYTKSHILARRTGAIALGVLAFPVMLFHPKRAQFYSYLHRVWSKTSNKPVWLAQSEMALAIRK
ncbi:YbfA family protein [Proteus myxofaciens]|uniref:Putative exported protein n=1 Tax=Proteus myxofaciens ATCC 19692 TaxID=1354337 RepID=A0A198FIP0_9GAMM|nr:YbfA family protein [Proteus myxofaciens]OAT24304.1 putative exported protein [Proteus myxofaciens ATCC 19692]